jgi:hypothetical protein
VRGHWLWICRREKASILYFVFFWLSALSGLNGKREKARQHDTGNLFVVFFETPIHVETEQNLRLIVSIRAVPIMQMRDVGFLVASKQFAVWS